MVVKITCAIEEKNSLERRLCGRCRKEECSQAKSKSRREGRRREE